MVIAVFVLMYLGLGFVRLELAGYLGAWWGRVKRKREVMVRSSTGFSARSPIFFCHRSRLVSLYSCSDKSFDEPNWKFFVQRKM
jgi:hypothetical protein